MLLDVFYLKNVVGSNLVIRPNAARFSFQPNPSILGLMEQPEPMLLGLAGHPDPMLLGLAGPPDISNFIFFYLFRFFSFLLFNFVFHTVKKIKLMRYFLYCTKVG
jgi:hypothetical protein